MNAVAQKITMDERDEFELGRLRELLTACLEARGGPYKPTSLSWMMTARKGRDSVLKRPSGKFEREEINVKTGEVELVKRVKPAHGQWTNTCHATPTRPAGFSRELGEFHQGGNAYTAAAVWRLHPVHIASIMARYSSNPKQRLVSLNELAAYIASRFRAEKVKDRALVMARLLLADRGAGDIRRALGVTAKEWRDSRPIRNTYYMVNEALQTLDAGALYAWQDECFRSISG